MTSTSGPGADPAPKPKRRAFTAEYKLRIVAEDFWIFDARLVALLNFDGDDDLVDVELITEPAEVNRYAQARDAAWHHAIRYDVFAANL